MLRLSAKYALIPALLLLPFTSAALGAEKLKQITSVYLDEKGVSLKYPEGAACDDKGGLVVADTANGRLLRYTYQEGTVKGGTELKPSQLVYPIRLQLGSKGDIYALDGKQRRIIHLKLDGAFDRYLDPQGVPAPTAVVPRSFKVTANDAIYLLDIFGERVLVLDRVGRFQSQLPFPKGYGFFSDLAVTAAGDVLLLDSVNAMVYAARKGAAEFTPLSKNLREYVSFPTYMTTDSRGVIYLVDQDGGAIVTLGQDGSFTGRMLNLGWKEGQLYYPGQICMGGEGMLAVADRNNSRVQVFEFAK